MPRSAEPGGRRSWTGTGLAARVGLAVLLLAAFASGVSAAIYSYTDETGAVHITDRPPAQGSYRILLTTLKRPEGFHRPAGARHQYGDIVARQASGNDLSPALLLAIIKAESNFDPRAVSPRGAQGLMQIMPETGRQLGLIAPFDPQQNIRAGARYFREMLSRFGDETLALAAYNAGPGRVEAYGGVPPFDETRAYIRRVGWYRALYSKTSGLEFGSRARELFDQGYGDFQAGRLTSAVKSFEGAVQEAPEMPEARYNLALALENIGQYRQATDQYREALRLDPYYREACHNLAILYERLGRLPEAIAAWKKLLEWEEDGDRAWEITGYVEELVKLTGR